MSADNKKMIFPLRTNLECRLPYFMDGVGCCYDQEDISRPTGHPYYQWIQVRRGKGILTLGKNEYLVGEGQGMLLFPKEPHFYKRTESIWDVDWIIFRGSMIEDFFLNIAQMKGSGVYHITSHTALQEKIVRLYNTALPGGPAASLACSALIYEILTDIMYLSSFSQNPSMDGRLRRLQPILDYINENFARPISLSVLAEIAGVTPQYLCSAFKKYTSKTIFEYINMTKVRKSKELLIADKNIQVKEAARLCGFSDDSYFCATFRRYEGMSPMEFKTKYGG